MFACERGLTSCTPFLPALRTARSDESDSDVEDYNAGPGSELGLDWRWQREASLLASTRMLDPDFPAPAQDKGAPHLPLPVVWTDTCLPPLASCCEGEGAELA